MAIVPSSISVVVIAPVAISPATMLSLKTNFEYTISAVALTSAFTISLSKIMSLVTLPVPIVVTPKLSIVTSPANDLNTLSVPSEIIIWPVVPFANLLIPTSAVALTSASTIVASSISVVVTAPVAISPATILSLKANFEYAIAAVALISVFTISSFKIMSLVTLPVAIVVAPTLSMVTSPLIVTSCASPLVSPKYTLPSASVLILEMLEVLVVISELLVSTNPSNTFPWLADNALVMLVEVRLFSTVMLTLVSTKFFKTFPCSADKGTLEPPVVRSSTMAVVAILVATAVVFVTIATVLFAIADSFIFTWASKMLSASLKEVALWI